MPERDCAPGVFAAGARPRERAERDAPVAEQAQRAQQVPQHLTPSEACSQVSATSRWTVSPSPAASACTGAQRSASAVAICSPVVSLISGVDDRQPVQRRHERDRVGRARQLGALEAGQREREALGAQLELGLLGEHIAQQRAQRQTRARPRRRLPADLRSVRACKPCAQRIVSPPGEVAIEPVEPRQRGERRLVLGQPRELRLALGDEATRQRAAAVERGLRAPPLGPQLQFDLRPGRDVGLQHVRGRLGVLAEGGLQLGGQSAGAHGPHSSPSRRALLPAHLRLQHTRPPRSSTRRPRAPRSRAGVARVYATAAATPASSSAACAASRSAHSAPSQRSP